MRQREVVLAERREMLKEACKKYQPHGSQMYSSFNDFMSSVSSQFFRTTLKKGFLLHYKLFVV